MNFSKEGQDIFVSALIKKPGFFLDIGVGTPIENNNTFLLETNGWRGILIDNDPRNIEQCRAQRSSLSVCADVTNIDWIKLLERGRLPKIIDYISMDVDDANIAVMQNFPWKDYQFKILTYETDRYNNLLRQRVCEQVLSDFPDYERILKDAQLEDGKPWEDWWVNKKYFDKSILSLKSTEMFWKDFLGLL